jgi:hypothetical protein
VTAQKPFSFTIAIADFDLGQLPEGARTPGAEGFLSAVSTYYA